MIVLSFICGGTAVTLDHRLAPVYTETRRGSNDSTFWLERIDHRFIYMYMEFQVYKYIKKTKQQFGERNFTWDSASYQPS